MSDSGRLCGNCGGSSWGQVVESPHTAGAIIALVAGIVLTPILIGIPLLLYSITLFGKKNAWWVCLSCGTRIPVAIEGQSLSTSTQGDSGQPKSAQLRDTGWWVLLAGLLGLVVLTVMLVRLT